MGSVLANLDSILQMPTGCGEQNMIKFAPNIYVLQYLTGTNQLTKAIEDKALNFLRIGMVLFCFTVLKSVSTLKLQNLSTAVTFALP